VPASVEIAYSAKQPTLAARLAELAFTFRCWKYQGVAHLSAIKMLGLPDRDSCLLFYVANIARESFANNLMLCLMSAGGYWEEVVQPSSSTRHCCYR